MSLRQPLLPTHHSKNGDTNGGAVSRSNKDAVSVTIACFVCFVAVRSFHPIVIDISKTDGKLPYGKATPCVVNSAADVVIGSLLAFMLGGVAGLRQCWDPEPLKIFSAIAVLYAFGDFMEMVSMSAMGGAAYQILLQSKLVVTALIMWFLRGQRQTLLQWNVLLTIALAMSAFVLVDSAGDSSAPFRPIGLFFVVVKVFFSCLCAVLVEKYLKAYKDMPIYVQLVQLKFAWFWTTLALTLAFDGNVRVHGFWDGWDWRTIVVAASWICKGWSTFLVLKRLDSVLKNIGEAAAILVIYLFEVAVAKHVSGWLPVHGKDFRLTVFLMVWVVVLTVISYTMAAPQKASVASKNS